MARVETNTRRIIMRLRAEGWQRIGGGKHEIYGHPALPHLFVVLSRQKQQSPGVARATARTAGWI
jgi:predicted RNA binding protein YcfA (HicA-like mRNA interferase family)